MKVSIEEKIKIKLEIEFESLEDLFEEIRAMGSTNGNSKIYEKLLTFINNTRTDYHKLYYEYTHED